MILKRILIAGLTMVICLSLFATFGNSTPSVKADLSYTQADVEQLTISFDVKVVGLGEASHGVAQYQQMKAEVFRSLVKNNGCRTFIIEGDFGSGLKVDRYINGGDGTAEETVREIGFTIYQTRKMTDLLQWMRSYNETVSPNETANS